MKLYERLGDRGYHSTIVATFCIDFDAFENIALPRLRSAGSRNNIIIADTRMLGSALESSGDMPKLAGRLYSVSEASAAGVFHPKIILQLGRKKGRLIIGSANATASGLAGNLELAGILECGNEESPDQQLIANVWHYLSRFLDQDRHTLSQQVAWATHRTPWLSHAAAPEGAVTLTDGTQASFLGTGQPAGIMERFVDLVGNDPVQKLTILSPYWDKDLAAVGELITALRPEETRLLVDKNRHLFPHDAKVDWPGCRIFDVGSLGGGRFVHAKLLLAATADADNVLYGSANCTIAALGRPGYGGSNEEASLFRRLPSGYSTEHLGLKEIIEAAEEIRAQDLPQMAETIDLPLGHLTSRHPGVFECVYNTLYWWPPGSCDGKGGSIELLDSETNILTNKLEGLGHSETGEIRFRILGLVERPAFARVKFADGTHSTLSVVSLVDVLHNEAKESRSKKAEKAAYRLDEETEEGLWLMEVLEDLAAAETAMSGTHGRRPSARISSRKGKDAQNGKHRTLDYPSFVCGRRLRIEGTSLRQHSLAGSDTSLVRDFLNRVQSLAIKSDTDVEADVEVEELFDLHDEVQDDHDAVESGTDTDDSAPTNSGQKQPSEVDHHRRRAQRRKQTRDQFSKACRLFVERVRQHAQQDGLTPIDVLRLRAILTIVVAAGHSGHERTVKQGARDKALTSLQVLPTSSPDNSWPHLAGMALYSFFGGRDPAINRLAIDDSHDQIPDDLIECWACCLWVAQAGLTVSLDGPPQPSQARSFERMLERIVCLSGLAPDELLSSQFIRLMDGMGDRFADRLGLDGSALMTSHRQFVGRILASSAKG